MSTVNELRAALEAPFPPEDIYQRQGAGGKMLSYISGTNVIMRVQEHCEDWSWEITETRTESTYSRDGEIIPVFVVMGRLTIVPLGTRSGIGVAVISPGAGEDVLKGAGTDAFKNAAKLFGVGMQLYTDDTAGAGSASGGGYSGGGNRGGKATEPQQKFVRDLMNALSLSRDDLNTRFATLLNGTTIATAEDLTFDQAKAIITALKDERDAKGGHGQTQSMRG